MRKQGKADAYYRPDGAGSSGRVPYKGCGLDNVYLLNGFEMYTDDDGEEMIAVHDVEALHRAIARHLVMNRKQLVGKEIRFIRRLMGLSQSELGAFMRLSDQQIARYEKDQFHLTGAADVLFRGYFMSFDMHQVDLRKMAQELQERDEGPSDELEFELAEEWKLAA